MKRTTLETVSNLEKELELILKQIGELRVFDFDETTTQRKMLGLHSDLDLVHKEFKKIIPKRKEEINTLNNAYHLKDKLNDDGFIACDLFTGEILNDDYK